MLGRALVAKPDLLLLDEPTNHLDIDAITWLEDMMLDFDGALLFISHDRAFVRRLATRIVELDRGQLRVWPGSYDEYVLQKRAALEVEASTRRYSTRSWLRKRFGFARVWRRGARATKAGYARFKQLRIQRAERRERIGQVEIRAQDAAPSGSWCSRRSTSLIRSAGRRSSRIFPRAYSASTASASSAPTAAARRR